MDDKAMVQGYLTYIVNCLNDIETKLDMLINLHERERGRNAEQLSDEQREILLAEGMTVREKAERLNKSVGWVSKWKKCLR